MTAGKVGETFGRIGGYGPMPRVLLICDCGKRFSHPRRLFEHCWTDHGRMPTRAERTPR